MDNLEQRIQTANTERLVALHSALIERSQITPPDEGLGVPIPSLCIAPIRCIGIRVSRRNV
jgi:hypothetical protein